MAPLQQINLKVSEAVAAHWRAEAAAAGLSVRDWLVSITAPTAAAPPASGAADVLQRLEALEAAVIELRTARPPRTANAPRPARAAAAQAAGPLDPGPAAEVPPLPPVVAGDAIETAALADRLGIKRGTMNARIARAGGAVPGLVIEGWRCLGLRTSERGGPPRALWQPVES